MSKKELKNKPDYIFEGRIREIEEELVEYRKERAEYGGTSTKVALIMTYLSIHGQLTQQQLKELTKFSISTISTQLANLVNIGYIKKEMVKGTHEYVYSSNFPSDDSVDEALGNLSPEIKFLKEKITELNSNANENFKGFKLLHFRLMEVLQTFEFYQEFIQNLQDPKRKLEKTILNFPSPKLTLNDLKNGSEVFDPEVKKIEDDILDFFLHQSAYSILKRYNLIIFVYFLTRKVFTQDQIKQLTGLSRGKISEALNFLIKKGFIEKIENEAIKALIPDRKTRKNYYSLLSIQKSFMVTGVNAFSEIFKWEPKFRELKSELESKKDELHSLNGYDKVLESLIYNLYLMSIYRKAYDFFSNYLD